MEIKLKSLFSEQMQDLEALVSENKTESIDLKRFPKFCSSLDEEDKESDYIYNSIVTINQKSETPAGYSSYWSNPILEITEPQPESIIANDIRVISRSGLFRTNSFLGDGTPGFPIKLNEESRKKVISKLFGELMDYELERYGKLVKLAYEFKQTH